MIHRIRITALSLGLGAVLMTAAVPHAPADDDDKKRRVDHKIARQALLRGEIMPLEALLMEIRKTVPGEFVGVELEFKHGIWVYTLKILPPDGKLVRFLADARTGRPIDSRKGRDR